ncbi:HDIG domain-containing protein [Clostridium tyrobutyricum]|jgi:putative nucleotidyltransferase with HDIG domain|uniref:Membrane protein containing HD superfamily hydrolase domain, YQFF ortholog n=1 Tax=Clostridium tyrobutyricum DIVETGP TaxID=1408889 RepID=W6N756_CLOTY|nr:HDIG domain-containing metalloprotein [Clostridium tyrobutyricum]AND85661.1 HD superfamily hydrolase domain-containing protein [Clostridium tyrobutyricum]ANP70184.1 phosphohydrolase [Clostridium tyrobutyricum]MBV4424390.1 HDIG domain-containing protein [Clostridium tyrobutyricum]MBV4429149.1 HDIG domain-containing protein [Clostridium tyrobutyricum]MBV4430782.1 HDIG domain-containing protein [Clostridium tyrobutyricum]
MKKLDLKRFFIREKQNRIIIFIVSFILIYAVLLTGLTTKRYNLKLGEIAKVDIKAPREVKDDLSTQDRVNQVLDSVPIQYNKKPEVKTETIDKINKFFSTVNPIIIDSQTDEKQKQQKIKSAADISLSDNDYLKLARMSKSDMDELHNFLIESMSDLYDNNNISDNSQKDNEEDIKKAQEDIIIKVGNSNLSKSIRDLAINIAYTQISPNFFYDKDKTQELKIETAKKVPPVMIKKDQIIVKEGEPVTKYQIGVLKDLGLLNDGSYFKWYIYISLAVLVVLILALQWIYLNIYSKSIYKDFNIFVMINILSFLGILFARSLGIISPFFIPLAFIPMIFSILVNSKTSLVINILNCVLISTAVEFNIEITILAMVNVIIGSIILRKLQQRNDILYATICIAVINIVLTVSMGFLLTNNVVDVAEKAIFTGIGSIISGILVIGFLPVFESSFNIVTTIKLLELSNPNNPLLKRLLMEAPGTYHHSILVGNLAEVATEEVGGNALFSRVAAYYHDIGKIKRPYFFKENQLGNDNPHDKITSALSAVIIISHVKDGVEMAKEYKLPKVIIDVIEQHHGTSLVKYFYVTMKNSSKSPEDVKEEDFRYPGPIPETKEAGIIMLADGVEAAVRSINEPNKDNIESMINDIINDRLSSGQLDNCDLTLRDITKIKAAFIKVLLGIYHHRIEYPKDKWADKNNKLIDDK